MKVRRLYELKLADIDGDDGQIYVVFEQAGDVEEE